MPTAIEWCEEVWNPVVGCSKVSEGCRNCYALRHAVRLAHNPSLPDSVREAYRRAVCKVNGRWEWSGKIALLPERLEQPLHWRKPRRVFVCSMSDLFHEDVTAREIQRIWQIMADTPRHTFMVLTKRPKRMAAVLDAMPDSVYWLARARRTEAPPLPNVGLMVTAENQRTADERIPILMQIPAAWRGVSVEPMLGPVDLMDYFPIYDYRPTYPYWQSFQRMSGIEPDGKPRLERPGLDLVICGGESGPGARPMHPEWARDLRDQCVAANVPFFFKQWGAWAQVPFSSAWDDGDIAIAADGTSRAWTDDWVEGEIKMRRFGKKKAGRVLDGREWNQWPGAPSRDCGTKDEV